MHLLGFSQAAASVSSLLKAFSNAKAPKKSKQPPTTASAATTAATTAATAAEQPTIHSHAEKHDSKNCNSSAATRTGSPNMFALGMTEACFQLRFFGDLLQRDVPPTPDPRVISFNPDLWQRKVLDAIDADASSVVCAPTSSGKTFISSYCMDRILRQSKDGIVVFVAPTKALVNQTAAQVTNTHV